MKTLETSPQLPAPSFHTLSFHEDGRNVLVIERQLNEQDTWQRAKELIHHRLSFKDRGIFEFSPFYLYPNTNSGYLTQSWDHPAFRSGIRFVTEVSGEVAREKVIHFVLVDDFNNVPEGVTNADIINRLMEAESVPELAESVLFAPDANGHRVVPHWESDFVRDGAENVCSNLDAAFQKEKILFEREADEVNLQNLRSTLLIVAHPVEFRPQQSLMLNSLLGEMKRPPFQRMSKAERITTLSELYCHVWFDNEGNIASVTRPVWNGNKFVHEELE